MKIVQYPHYLFAVNAGGDSVQDENGNWSDAETTNIFISTCREETNGRGNELQVAGGLFYKFSSLVQMPQNAMKVNEGTTVFVSDSPDGTGMRIKGQVLKFDKGQLHCRLWIN